LACMPSQSWLIVKEGQVRARFTYPPNLVGSGGKKLPVLGIIGVLGSLVFPVPLNEFEDVF